MATQLEALHQNVDDVQYTTDDVRGAGATAYAAGAETTSSSLWIFLLAMVLYPESQVRAQEELDAVIGAGRLPDFNDRPALPYLECLVKEVLRWHHPLPSGVPHRSLDDDVYDGMFIPKGSIIIANIRGMTWDEELYNNPRAFDPSRYLPAPHGKGEPLPAATWGFGRRICPGRHFADATLWIAIATILSTLNISKAVADDGKEITPEEIFQTSVT
ncbi:hypothetical protein H0H87_006846, partial [Tephrocybe sp. NHM501043]